MIEKELLEFARQRSSTWLEKDFDELTRQEVKTMMDDDSNQGRKNLIDAFYKDIDFGTGGVRGIMEAGTNRINRYTLSRVTRGLINFASKNFPSDILKVAIAYDTRNRSKVFSRQVAEIFASSGAEVFLFQEAMPTPLLSYAVRRLGCRIGIVITASHNPKEYNGYKVYFDDGAQIVSPRDKSIIAEVNQVVGYEAAAGSTSGSIKEIREEVVKPYWEDMKVLISSLCREADFSLPVVFSSLHGTGGKLIIPFLKELGFSNVHTVAKQMEENGDFPTVVYPNPEEAEALSMGLELMEKTGAAILMATDPDSDRLGAAVRDQHNKPQILNGNQIGVLLTDFILSSYKTKGFPPNPFLVRTIVTTPLVDPIAEDYGIELFKVLTGFKYFGELIRRFEGKKNFIFGFEESHGYLASDKVRDKDAVSSALLFAVMAAYYQQQGISLYQRLTDIYQKYGFCYEALASLTKTGPQGKDEIEAIIASLREDYGGGKKKNLGDDPVVFFRDYGNSFELNLQTQNRSEILLPSSEVIQLQTQGGCTVSIRPSGTEPKIKFYFSVNIPLSGTGDLYAQVGEAKLKAEGKIEALKKIFI